MKTIKTLLNITFLIFLISGCMDAEKALEGELIEKESLIDNKKFIEESKKRADKVVQYGPDAAEIDDSNVRETTREILDKEEAPNYDELQDDGTGKIFPIDLNVENVDIRTFTQMLSKITNINFLVSDEVTGFVTAKLENVSWPNALDSVLSLKSLAKHVDNNANIIRIHSQTTIVALESFQRKRKEDLQKTAQLAKATEPLYTEVFKLFYTNPEEVSGILRSVLGISDGEETGGRNTNAQITIDNRANQLIVKARKDDLDMMQKVIEKIDSRTKQVFIEAFVVEVNDDFEKQLGVELGANLNTGEDKTDKSANAPTSLKSFNLGLAGTGSGTPASLFDFTVDGATSGLVGTFGVGDATDLRVALTALEADSVSKIISNPRIFTLDNQEAVIFQGTEVPYETVSADGTSIEFKQAGLNLAVTPTVVGDGNLMLAISLNKDTVDTSISNPPITSSSINTNLVTKDGSIVVIGGIYTQTKTDSQSKVPFFGDVPVAGKLFRRDGRENDRKELMIFIAPRVI
jgi:type IV pilus assembly protein PilQ